MVVLIITLLLGFGCATVKPPEVQTLKTWQHTSWPHPKTRDLRFDWARAGEKFNQDVYECRRDAGLRAALLRYPDTLYAVRWENIFYVDCMQSKGYYLREIKPGED